MLQAVIFDMDGVIVDSEGVFLRSKQRFLRELGVEIEDQYHNAFIGTTSEHTWSTMKQDLGLAQPVDELIRRANEIREQINLEEGLQPIPGVLDLITHLHEQGLPLAVASSSPIADILHTLETFQCKDRFQVFASGCDCERSKPFPDVFLATAEKLGIEPVNCLVIEDSRNGTLAAKAANMTCVAFNNLKYPPQDLSQADQVVTDFTDLNIDVLRKLVP
jgi:HAD superfamily hydrolase (TIGR01509 family)